VHSLLTFDSETLTIRPWTHDVIDRVGFDPRSPYVERFWLGVLGPSTTWLMRRFAAGFDAEPDGFELPLGETARALGLGDRGGRNSPFLRSLNRCIQFEMAQVIDPTELAVRRRLPALNRRHLMRLAPAQQEEHRRFQERQLAEPDNATQERRSRQLALSLLELGEDREEAWRRHCSALEAAEAG
jgi:hypothetical protein